MHKIIASKYEKVLEIYIDENYCSKNMFMNV